MVKIKKSSVSSPETSSPVGQHPPELQLIALKDVRESQRNAKMHTSAQVDEIVASIREFGFRDPIALTEGLEIIEGHGRVLALKKMGAEYVPAQVFSDMTPEQVRSYRIAHNQLTLKTGFDLGALTVELRDLENTGMDLSLTGFSLDDLSGMEEELGFVPEVQVSPSKDPGMASESEPVEESEPTGGLFSEVEPVYQYVLIFDDKEQHSRWARFVRLLKEEREEETIAARLLGFVSEYIEFEE